jgi:hypothetical protein
VATDFTIADVLMWARTMPAGEGYCYSDIHGCALCQFFRHAGIKFEWVGGWTWRDEKGGRHDFPPHLEEALVLGGTFGGLVSRLEAHVPAEPISDTWTKADAYLTDIDAVSA